jgi:hypothetical protein
LTHPKKERGAGFVRGWGGGGVKAAGA